MHVRSQQALPAPSALWNPWVAFFALILAAWVALFLLAAGHGDAATHGPGAQWVEPLFAVLPGEGTARGLHVHGLHSNLALLLAMWSLMCVAMMAPTAVPLLRTYRHLSQGNPDRVSRLGFWALAMGHVVVWCGYSAVAAAAQSWLSNEGFLTSSGVSTSTWLSVGLLAAAGAYQFSSLKEACLSRCRSPMAFLLGHWRVGAGGAFRMGLRHGAFCVGCCWALMALSFVGGTMNLLWMGAAMVLMIVEKLSLGRWLTAPIGIALLAAAAVTSVQTLGHL